MRSRPFLADDNALHALVGQRADLVAHLAPDLGEDSFVPPDWTEDGGTEGWDGPNLSPIEAFLIDIALSSPEREESWLTHEEARKSFGEEAAYETLVTRRWRSTSATMIALAGALGRAFVYVIARQRKGPMRTWLGGRRCLRSSWSPSSRPSLAGEGPPRRVVVLGPRRLVTGAVASPRRPPSSHGGLAGCGFQHAHVS